MEKNVAIIGLGYVGLPLACLCARKGHKVKGLDVDAKKVSKVNKGESPIRDEYVEKWLPKVQGSIKATTEPAEALSGAQIAIVCVPTPAVNSKPDLSFVKSACKTLAPFVSKGELVIIESTVYPGTVEEIALPLIEKGSGLKAGKDFFIGHCPERIDPGNKEFTIEKIPRVVACLSKQGSEKAKQFYSSIVDAKVTVLSSVKSVEAVKVVENTFRDINIAFVNELARSFDKMGIDICEVIRGASTKPFGYMPFYPGPGVGGHCIAQDPYYLIERARQSGFKHRFLSLAREINEDMPKYVAGLVLNSLKEIGVAPKNAKIALLGLAYKPNVDDPRESPSLKVLLALRKSVSKIKTFDPFLLKESSAESAEEAVRGTDLVILGTHHPQLVKVLSAKYLKEKKVKAVVDARNALDAESIKSTGILYKGIGR